MTESRPSLSRKLPLLFQGLLIGLVASVLVTLDTPFNSPPRYDGAGYATLGWGLAQGQGYREWHHPDAQPHTHFPPGYPLALAGLFKFAGRSVFAAHVLSIVLTVSACILYWRWFVPRYGRRTALILGLALAVNWTWGRTGGTIQSEPLFFFLGALVLHVEVWSRDKGLAAGLLLGVMLGACVLTRHVGTCLAMAIVVQGLMQRRFVAMIGTLLGMGMCLLPWVGWLATSQNRSQAGLFMGGNLIGLVADQTGFYLRRIPDQVMGPVVEIATVFTRSNLIAGLATTWALLVSGVVVVGWVRLAGSPRRRLAALIPGLTFPLLLVWPFTEAGRFLIPLVPFLILGLAEGLAFVLSFKMKRSRRFAARLVLLVSLPYPLYSAATGRAAAQERTHQAFDSACSWIVAEGNRSGPIVTHYAADLSWQTGRRALEVDTFDHKLFLSALHRYNVAYVIVDEQPFANAPPDPAGAAVKAAPGSFILKWGPIQGVSIYERQHEVEHP
ncbi:ArnT family glycosyltransferase [Singulisphaera sp. PoT]|uniref:ArnT family glycosyltransferase n=1 Tax=Singulisphaera sp. PoT TaxID=3411797 RepID=UPI003BF5794A